MATMLAHAGPAAILDREGRVLVANPRGDVLRELFDPSAPNSLCSLAVSAVEGGIPVMKSVEVRRPSGIGALDLTLLPSAGGRRVAVLGRDSSLELNLRAALAESRQRYKDFVDLSSDFTWEVGADGNFVFVSPTGALGYSARDLVGRDPISLLDDRDKAHGTQVFRCAVRVHDTEIWTMRRDGTLACLVASAMPVLGSDGEWMGARGVCQDVTEQRERDKALNRSRNRERILTYVVRTFRDELDPARMLHVAAEALAKGLGTTGCTIYRVPEEDGEDIQREFILRGLHGKTGDQDDIIQILTRLDTEGMPVETILGSWQVIAAAARYRRQVNGAVVLWRKVEETMAREGWTDDDRLLVMDIANQIGIANEQIGQHERIITMSRTDSLTGLLNRRAFFDDMDRRIRRLSKDGILSCLMYVDLDNFKLVNDAHGHHKGDEALLIVKDILVHHTRPTDMVARLGGDEFAVWLDGADPEVAERKAQEFLQAAIRLRPLSGDEERPLTLSVGVSVYDPEQPEPLELLTARADAAMYAAKKMGKNSYHVALRKSDAAAEGEP